MRKLTPNTIKLPDAQDQGIQIQVPQVAVLEALREAMEDQYKNETWLSPKFLKQSVQNIQKAHHRDCQVYVGRQVVR